MTLDNREKTPKPIDKEVSWDKTQTIMSKTDIRGVIEYANETFVNVCGYEDYELMGKAHNIIRNPDMPKIIFKILWKNLKEGNNFHAVVKNLAKSGQYYWVITDFEIIEDKDGFPINYIARRRSVPDEVISHIEPLYRKLLQIEMASGINYSEKYLIGFLEEQNKNYVEYIIDLIQKAEQHENGNLKSFFNSFFR